MSCWSRPRPRSPRSTASALIPPLAQAEGYFREIGPKVFPGCDVDQEWDLLAHRQAHRPARVTRLLEVIIDESALFRLNRPCRSWLASSVTCSPCPAARTPQSGSSLPMPCSTKAAVTCSTCCPSRAPPTGSASATLFLGAQLASGDPVRPVDPDRGHLGRLVWRRAGPSSNGT